jgi:YVTN family beta-propeller protein
VTPDGTKVYVTNYNSNTVSVIAAATNTLSATIPVGSYPDGIAVSPDGSEVYVANAMANSVSVIDTATSTVTATIPVGSSPNGVAVSPDGTKVYTAHKGSNTVSVIDTATRTATATISVGSTAVDVAVSPDGTKVYAANFGSKTVSVIDTATSTVTATIPVGSSPAGIAVSPDGTKVYVANSDSDSVSVISAATNTVSSTLNVGAQPIVFGRFIGPAIPPPIVDFTASATSGTAPLTVDFTDTSPGGPVFFAWAFGDGEVSTDRNPSHTYTAAGTYSVSFAVVDAVRGANMTSRTGYITVTSATAGTNVTSIVIDPATPVNIWAGLDGSGIYRSTNGGSSWTNAGTQPANLHIRALAINPTLTSRLWAGTYGGGVFRSINSGTDWDACTVPANPYVLSLVRNASGSLYAGTDNGIFVSSDDCASWIPINGGLP